MSAFEMPPTRPYNERFWEAAAEGSLEVQYCPDCDDHVYPPRSACPTCFGDTEWDAVAGTGTLYSYAVIHHPDPPSAVDDEDLPMLGCVVELDEGVRIASRLVDYERADAEVGMEVAVTFDETPDGRSIPVFEPN